MRLQWMAVATFLYAEVFLVLLLCFPSISPTRWQKIFKSRLVQLIVAYGNTFFVILIVILLLLLLDAFREIQKYGIGDLDLKNNPVAVEHIHKKLLRAQHKLYIAVFSLLLAFLLRCLVTLICKEATVIASNEAFKKQAEGASNAAKKYMDENDKLKKQLKATRIEVSVVSDSNAKEENKIHKGEVKKLKDELVLPRNHCTSLRMRLSPLRSRSRA